MNIGNKRKGAMEGESKPKRTKKECDYGERCYRRNPAHFREFSHKHLESILDNYSGVGDYPIPEKYILERLAIMEQLDVIIEKDLYAPWKDRPGSSQQSSSSNSTSTQNNTDNNIKLGISTNTSSINTQASNHNTQESTRNTQASAERARLNISNTQAINQNTQESIRNTQASDKNTQESIRNTQASDKNTQESIRNTQACTSIAGSSRDIVTSDPGLENTTELTKRVQENSGNANEARSSNNNIATDYRKAPDYRPIVPPTRRVEDFLSVVRPKGRMAAKHAASAPYYIFYTTIAAAKDTHSQSNSITFLEILDHSLGELRCSLQINFMVELGWLLSHYYFAGYSQKRLIILYGEDMPELRTISEKKPHIDAHRVVMRSPFGTHHTKMMLLCYEDGSLRVVMSTANLYMDDWENRTQGLWFSPACPELPPSASPLDGESPTYFKRSLLRYLQHYHMRALDGYVERVRRADFSHINVFLVASVPGSHSDAEWGMMRVSSLLRQHCAVDQQERWPLVAQASSLGSYGPRPQLWLTGDFLHHFTKTKFPAQVLTPPAELKLIYPSLENVRMSHDGLLGGGCLPYGASVHTKQPWLTDYLYQWRATSSRRDRAMPHIKSYTRVSRDNKSAAYYLLTSANVSKAAWGSVNKGDGNLRIMSYEAGVLLLPRYVINKDFFPLTGESNPLPLAYDLPPTKYADGMSPWVMDYLHK